jgi:hypothetical protein
VEGGEWLCSGEGGRQRGRVEFGMGVAGEKAGREERIGEESMEGGEAKRGRGAVGGGGKGLGEGRTNEDNCGTKCTHTQGSQQVCVV